MIRKFLRAIIIPLVMVAPSCPGHPGEGKHKELLCTIILRTQKATIREEGSVVVDLRDVESLECYEVYEEDDR